MYEIGYSGGLKTRVTNRAEFPSPIGTQLKYDIDRKQDVTIEAENDGDMVVTFAPYHAIEVADYTISVRAAEDPNDANCHEEESGTVLFDGVVNLTEGEEALAGTVSTDSAMEVGYFYSIDLNGHSLRGLASYNNGVEVSIFNEDTGTGLMLLYNTESGTVTVKCTADIGTVGENTLVIEKVDAPDIEGDVYFEGQINVPTGSGFVSLDGASALSLSCGYAIQANGRTAAGVPQVSGQMIVVRIPAGESDGTILRAMNNESNPNAEISLAQMFGAGDVYVKIVKINGPIS